MLSCCVRYNFPEADPERIEKLRVFLSQKTSPRMMRESTCWVKSGQALSGRISNQILQILAGPAASNGKSTLLNLISHLVQTIIAICVLQTSLRRVRKPTYPDFKHHIHRGCIQASRSGSSFLHPDFCKSGAFGAGLITLDGPMPTFLYHVCLQAPKMSSNNGAACSRASK